MITIKSNFEIIGQTEEISFTTKIFEALNKKEYRKKLQEKENIYKTLSFKSFTEKELNFFENLSIEAIDKQCLLTLKESELAFDYVSNINNHYIYVKIKKLNGKTLEKYNFDDILINNQFLKIYDGINEEYFKTENISKVIINNIQYYKFYVVKFDNPANVSVWYDYLLNDYSLSNTKVCFLNKVEIQSKNLDIKETFKKFGEIKIKFKILDEKGIY